MEDGGLRVRRCANTGVGEILRVDELVAVFAATDGPDAAAFVDEFEEDGEETEPAEIDDGRAADDGDVQVMPVFFEDLLAFPFGAAVDLDGARGFGFGERVIKAAAPETVGRGEDQVFDTTGAGSGGHGAGAIDIGGPEEVLVVHRVGEDGGAVVDGVEFRLGVESSEEFGVADIALNGGEERVVIVVLLQVDIHDARAFVEQAAFEDTAEESGASGDEYVFHVGWLVLNSGRVIKAILHETPLSLGDIRAAVDFEKISLREGTSHHLRAGE